MGCDLHRKGTDEMLADQDCDSVGERKSMGRLGALSAGARVDDGLLFESRGLGQWGRLAKHFSYSPTLQRRLTP